MSASVGADYTDAQRAQAEAFYGIDAGAHFHRQFLAPDSFTRRVFDRFIDEEVYTATALETKKADLALEEKHNTLTVQTNANEAVVYHAFHYGSSASIVAHSINPATREETYDIALPWLSPSLDVGYTQHDSQRVSVLPTGADQTNSFLLTFDREHYLGDTAVKLTEIVDTTKPPLRNLAGQPVRRVPTAVILELGGATVFELRLAGQVVGRGEKAALVPLASYSAAHRLAVIEATRLISYLSICRILVAAFAVANDFKITKEKHEIYDRLAEIATIMSRAYDKSRHFPLKPLAEIVQTERVRGGPGQRNKQMIVLIERISLHEFVPSVAYRKIEESIEEWRERIAVTLGLRETASLEEILVEVARITDVREEIPYETLRAVVQALRQAYTYAPLDPAVPDNVRDFYRRFQQTFEKSLRAYVKPTELLLQGILSRCQSSVVGVRGIVELLGAQSNDAAAEPLRLARIVALLDAYQNGVGGVGADLTSTARIMLGVRACYAKEEQTEDVIRDKTRMDQESLFWLDCFALNYPTGELFAVAPRGEIDPKSLGALVHARYEEAVVGLKRAALAASGAVQQYTDYIRRRLWLAFYVAAADRYATKPLESSLAYAEREIYNDLVKIATVVWPDWSDDLEPKTVEEFAQKGVPATPVTLGADTAATLQTQIKALELKINSGVFPTTPLSETTIGESVSKVIFTVMLKVLDGLRLYADAIVTFYETAGERGLDEAQAAKLSDENELRFLLAEFETTTGKNTRLYDLYISRLDRVKQELSQTDEFFFVENAKDVAYWNRLVGEVETVRNLLRSLPVSLAPETYARRMVRILENLRVSAQSTSVFFIGLAQYGLAADLVALVALRGAGLVADMEDDIERTEETENESEEQRIARLGRNRRERREKLAQTERALALSTARALVVSVQPVAGSEDVPVQTRIIAQQYLEVLQKIVNANGADGQVPILNGLAYYQPSASGVGNATLLSAYDNKQRTYFTEIAHTPFVADELLPRVVELSQDDVAVIKQTLGSAIQEARQKTDETGPLYEALRSVYQRLQQTAQEIASYNAEPRVGIIALVAQLKDRLSNYFAVIQSRRDITAAEISPERFAAMVHLEATVYATLNRYEHANLVQPTRAYVLRPGEAETSAIDILRRLRRLQSKFSPTMARADARLTMNDVSFSPLPAGGNFSTEEWNGIIESLGNNTITLEQLKHFVDTVQEEELRGTLTSDLSADDAEHYLELASAVDDAVLVGQLIDTFVAAIERDQQQPDNTPDGRLARAQIFADIKSKAVQYAMRIQQFQETSRSAARSDIFKNALAQAKGIVQQANALTQSLREGLSPEQVSEFDAARLKLQLEDLKKVDVQMTAARTSLEQTAREIKRLTDEVAKADMSSEGVLARYRRLLARVSTVEQERAQVTARLGVLTNELDGERDRISEFSTNVATVATQISAQRSEFARADREWVTLGVTLNTLQARVNGYVQQFTDDNSEWSRRLQALGTFDAALAQANAARSKIEEALAAVAEGERQLKDASKENADLTKKTRKFVTEAEAFQAEVATALPLVNRAAQTYTAARETYDTLAPTLDELPSRQQELSKQLKSAKDFEKAAKQFGDDTGNLRATVDAAAKDYNDAKAIYDPLQARVNELPTNLRELTNGVKVAVDSARLAYREATNELAASREAERVVDDLTRETTRIESRVAELTRATASTKTAALAAAVKKLGAELDAYGAEVAGYGAALAEEKAKEATFQEEAKVAERDVQVARLATDGFTKQSQLVTTLYNNALIAAGVKKENKTIFGQLNELVFRVPNLNQTAQAAMTTASRSAERILKLDEAVAKYHNARPLFAAVTWTVVPGPGVPSTFPPAPTATVPRASKRRASVRGTGPPAEKPGDGGEMEGLESALVPASVADTFADLVSFLSDQR